LVSIVIVNYNTRDLLLGCLRSIYEKSTPETFEIVVVDNASADGSVEAVQAKFSEVRVHALPTNLGFGGANNVGVALARGEFVLLLNSDTVFMNDAVAAYLSASRRLGRQTPGALGAQLYDREGKITHSYGWFPRVHEEILHRLGLRRLPVEDTTPLGTQDRRVEYVTGAALFLRTEDFRRIGGFSPRFFMYYEDNELQWRLWHAGKASFVVSGPRILHLVGQSIARNNIRRTFTAVSKVAYYHLTLGRVGSLAYRSLFLLLETLLVGLDLLRVNPNYTPRENGQFLACLVTGSLRYLRMTHHA